MREAACGVRCMCGEGGSSSDAKHEGGSMWCEAYVWGGGSSSESMHEGGSMWCEAYVWGGASP